MTIKTFIHRLSSFRSRYYCNYGAIAMRRFLAFLFIYAVVIFGLHLMFGDWPWMTRNVQAAGTTYYISISREIPTPILARWHRRGNQLRGCRRRQVAAGRLTPIVPIPVTSLFSRVETPGPLPAFPLSRLAPEIPASLITGVHAEVRAVLHRPVPERLGPRLAGTRQIFDAQQTTISHYFTFDNEDYQIVDDIDMRNQNLTFTFGASSAIQATPGGSIAVVHILVETSPSTIL